MIFDVTDDLFITDADSNCRIIDLLGKFPILGRILS